MLAVLLLGVTRHIWTFGMQSHVDSFYMMYSVIGYIVAAILQLKVSWGVESNGVAERFKRVGAYVLSGWL